MGVRITVSPRDRRDESESDAVYEFDQDRIRLGRGDGSDVVLPHRSVSVRHATIEQQKGRYAIVDHGSTNGTLVNGQRIVPERQKPLRDGDRIDLGAFALAWKEAVPVAAAPSAERTATHARRLLRAVLGGAPPPDARLVVANGPRAGESLAIPAPPARLLIGRGEACDLAIPDADASREHVEIVVDLDGALARDRGSKNGLVINERRVPEKRLLDRDELAIGGTIVIFEDPAAAAVKEASTGADEPIAEPPPPAAPPIEPASAPAYDPDAPTGEPDPVAPAPRDAPPPAPRASRTFSAAELVIYALAALVFLASIAGLFVLLRAE